MSKALFRLHLALALWLESSVWGVQQAKRENQPKYPNFEYSLTNNLNSLGFIALEKIIKP